MKPCKILIIISLLFFGSSIFANDSKNIEKEEYYESILSKLNKSYIINFTIEDKYSNCGKMTLTEKQMIQDSLDYYLGVQEFFDCDKGVLNYLLRFENDTTKCYWIRQICPFAARKTRPSFLITEKRIAALILIENYLDQNQEKIIIIPRIPNINIVYNKQNLCLLDYKSLKIWLEGYGQFSKETMIETFKYLKRPWYRVYDYIDIEEKWNIDR